MLSIPQYKRHYTSMHSLKVKEIKYKSAKELKGGEDMT